MGMTYPLHHSGLQCRHGGPSPPRPFSLLLLCCRKKAVEARTSPLVASAGAVLLTTP